MSSEGASGLPTYHERYCAFVDILGFSELIAELGKGMVGFEQLRDLLQNIRLPAAVPIEGSDLRAQSISDALCISTSCTNAGLSHMFFVLTTLALQLLLKGFFMRGAIVKGNLYHDDHMVFGEAQVRAYLLERDIVRYPRIMVTAAVVSDAQTQSMTHFGQYKLADFIAESEDGPRYLDVLAMIALRLRDGPNGPERTQHLDGFNEMARQIQRRFDESRDNPKHFEKAQWFSKYWNRIAPKWGVVGIFHQASDGISRELVV
jgi:hypothetical protein